MCTKVNLFWQIRGRVPIPHLTVCPSFQLHCHLGSTTHCHQKIILDLPMRNLLALSCCKSWVSERMRSCCELTSALSDMTSCLSFMAQAIWAWYASRLFMDHFWSSNSISFRSSLASDSFRIVWPTGKIPIKHDSGVVQLPNTTGFLHKEEVKTSKLPFPEFLTCSFRKKWTWRP